MICYIATALVPEHMLIFNVSDFLKGPEIDDFFCLINYLDVEKEKKNGN